MKLLQVNLRDLIGKKKEFGFKITIHIQIGVFKLLEAFEIIFACGILKSGFKTFNRAQGQGGLGPPTAGISGIFRGLAVTVQHGDLSTSGGLRSRGGYKTTSSCLAESEVLEEYILFFPNPDLASACWRCCEKNNENLMG
jgi:hypothetical protein